MADKSKIEWTDATWTPIRARHKVTGRVGWHCEHATTGCAICYAEKMNKRLGTGLPFKPGHRQDIDLFLDEKMLAAPLRWRRPRTVFVCSMTDLFADFVPDEWIDKVFTVMASARQHTFQVLTKRPQRARAYLSAFRPSPPEDGFVTRDGVWSNDSPRGAPIFNPALWPRPNVWLGVSAEDQQRADERIPELLSTPAAIRFVSAEPLLGPIDVAPWLGESGISPHGARFWNASWIDWVIVGGESGKAARPMRLAWARSIVTQCRAAGVACFVKQLGTYPETDIDEQRAWVMRSPKGGDPSEWPADLRVREMPDS